MSGPDAEPVTKREGVLLPLLAEVLLVGDEVARASLFCLFTPPDPDPDPNLGSAD
jgi:hypothetical protein